MVYKNHNTFIDNNILFIIYKKKILKKHLIIGTETIPSIDVLKLVTDTCMECGKDLLNEGQRFRNSNFNVKQYKKYKFGDNITCISTLNIDDDTDDSIPLNQKKKIVFEIKLFETSSETTKLVGVGYHTLIIDKKP